MSMIYNLVTAAQEWLAARVAAGPSSSGLDPEAEEKRKREEEVGLWQILSNSCEL